MLSKSQFGELLTNGVADAAMHALGTAQPWTLDLVIDWRLSLDAPQHRWQLR
jgi:hypothetical protein